MAKTVVIDQIEITQSGVMQLRFLKLSSDGDPIGYHRTVIEPGQDAQAALDATNSALEQMGFARLSEEHADRIKSFVPVAHTEKVIAAFRK